MTGVTARVEIEFTTGVWTDVSAYWDAKKPVTFTGGRSDTDERVNPGRLSGLVLTNTDGRFTIGNSSGAYWPNVASGKRLRVRVKDPGSATYYTRWTGSIDGWPLSWEDNGATCLVTLSATDALLPMQERFTGWLDYYWRWRSADHYWSMTDNHADRHHVESRGGPTMWPVGSDVTACTEAGPGADSSPLPYGGTGIGWAAYGLPGSDAGEWIAQCLFKAPSPPGGDFAPMRATAGALSAAIYVTAAGYLRAAYYDGSWVTAGADSVNICDGNWWLLTLRGTPDDDDDSAVATYALRLSDGATTTAYKGNITPARALLNTPLTLGVGQRGYVGHVAYSAGVATFWQEREAFTGLLEQWMYEVAAIYNDISPHDVTLTYLGETQVRMHRRPVPSTWSGWWEHVEAVDGGVLFAERDGTRTYLSGEHRTRPVGGTSAVVGLALTAADVNGLEVAADRLPMCNSASVTSVDVLSEVHASIMLTDAASITRSGERAKTAAVYGLRKVEGTGRGVIGIANELLAPVEVPRIPAIVLDALTQPNAIQQALLFGDYGSQPVDMWSLVAVTGMPTAGAMPDRWLGRVEGWTETLGIDVWSITFNTSFAGALVGSTTFARVGSMRLG